MPGLGKAGSIKELSSLETRLDSLDSAEREQAVVKLAELSAAFPPEPVAGPNLHCHTFYSYNAYGYSPSKIAWLARKGGWAVAGIVDFDVLDGAEEFLRAASRFGVKACVGIETRVFVPEFAELEINSPGEPGIAYHMGVGFPSPNLEPDQEIFLGHFRSAAAARNRSLVERVNSYLSPVELDYDKEVTPLTPSGNATERHTCLAYARKAHTLFPTLEQLTSFWETKLRQPLSPADLPEGPGLLSKIRSVTMKRGGIGYVQPDRGAFPRMEEMNQFVLAAGGIPTLAWLDGTSPGEERIEELLAIAMNMGTAAINIIPDRNYIPGVRDKKLAYLERVVGLAQKLSLPIIVGTEMNSPGQRILDDFDSRELAPLAPAFLEGALIVYAHSLLQPRGMGYTGEWARKYLPNKEERNRFTRDLGSHLAPNRVSLLADLPSEPSKDTVLDAIRKQ